MPIHPVCAVAALCCTIALYLSSVYADSILFALFEPSHLCWGSICGCTVGLANLLIVESMRSLPASVASTIYRLNTVSTASSVVVCAL